MILAVSGTYYGNLVVAGVAVGAVYALYGLGITLIYKASKVPNFAHAATGMVGAYVFFKFWNHATVLNHHRLQHPELSFKVPFFGGFHKWVPPVFPMWAALLLSLVVVAILGLGIERLVIRPLGNASTLTYIIVTVALLGLLTGLGGDVFGQQAETVNSVFPRTPVSIFGFNVEKNSLGLLAVTLVLAGLLTLFFRYTTLGVAVRSVADDREVSRLMGIDANRVSAFAWAVGLMMAAIAGILISPDTQLNSFGLAALIVFGFTAALLGGFSSLMLTVAGGILLGVVGSLVTGYQWPHGVLADVFASNGARTFVTLAVVVGILMFRPHFIFKGVRLDEDTGVFARGGTRLAPEDAIRRALFRANALPVLLVDWAVSRWVLATCVLAAMVLVPIVLTAYWSTVLAFGLIYALVALSVIVLTGWTGQLSLAPFAFVGVGAFACAILSTDLHVPFFLVPPLCGVACIPFALIVGAPALRLRGFFLALATLAFGAAASDWLFPIAVSKQKDHVYIPKIHLIWNWRGSSKPTYLIAALTTAAVLVLVRNVYRSRIGRCFFALRDSESTAVSFGIDPARYKLLAFGVSGFIAGVGGALLGYLSPTVQPNQFDYTFSLQWILATVVASVIIIPGALLAAFLFSVVPQLTASHVNGVNQAPVILGAVAAIRTVTDYPKGLAVFLTRLVRPFEAGERLAWRSAETEESTVIAEVADAREEREEELFVQAASSGSDTMVLHR